MGRRRRRFRRRRRHAGGAARGVGTARVPARGRRRRARAGRARHARRPRRAGVPPVRVRAPGHALGFPRAPLRRCRAAVAGLEEPRRHGAVPARRHAGRLHRAQRDDLRAAPRLRLERHRRTHGRRHLARGQHAPLRPPGGGLPPPAVLALPGGARHRPAGPRLARLAARRARDAARGVLRRRDAAPGRRHHGLHHAGRAASVGQPVARAARPRRSERAPAGRPAVRGRLLHAAVHDRPPAHGQPGPPAGRARGPPRSAAHRARRAGHAGAVRRAPTCRGRRVSAWPAPVPRACRARHRSRRAAPGARAPRGGRVRRGVQHAAAADAVGHRAGRRTAAPRHRAAGRPARRRPQPAGSLRGGGHAPAAAAVGRPARRALHPRRRRVAGMERHAARGHVRLQRRHHRRGASLEPAGGRPGHLRDGAAHPFRGVLPRVFEVAARTSRLPQLGRAEGPHAQPRGPRAPALRRRARHARDRLPLLRSGRRPGRRRPARRRRRDQARAPRDGAAGALGRGVGRAGARGRRRVGRGAGALRAKQRLGPSRIVLVPDRRAGAGRRGRQPIPRPRHAGPARRRRVGLPAHPRLLPG